MGKRDRPALIRLFFQADAYWISGEHTFRPEDCGTGRNETGHALFLNYNIDEPLPWHSTLSRTRKLYGEELFLKVFNHILELCIKTGMVDGRTQAIDSTLIKANASMASLSVNLKIAGQEYYNKLKNNSEEDNTKYPPKSKDPRRQENERRVSLTDPDSKMATKSGRPLSLCYQAQISVDTASHIICGALGLYANIRDSQCLPLF